MELTWYTAVWIQIIIGQILCIMEYIYHIISGYVFETQYLYAN